MHAVLILVISTYFSSSLYKLIATVPHSIIGKSIFSSMNNKFQYSNEGQIKTFLKDSTSQ